MVKARSLTLAALLLVGACARGEGRAAQPRDRATTAASVTVTTVPADPYATPAVIDAEYLNRVLAALDAVNGEATRIILHEQLLVPDAVARLQAIYGREELNDQLRLWGDDIAEGLRGYRQPAGDRASTVRRIISANLPCLFVEVVQDFSAVALEPSPPGPNYLALERVDPSSDRTRFNPTPWKIVYSGLNRDGSEPANPCAGP